jgi:hypothetical protein
MEADDLGKFDAFDFVHNDDLKAVYWDAVATKDEDLKWIEKEMIKRGLLGSC